MAGYPAASNLVARFNHSSAVQEYNESVKQLDPAVKEEELQRAQEYNKMLTGSNIEDPFVPDSGYVMPDDYEAILSLDAMMGYIRIPKINLSLPIYHGTSEQVLKQGVGHLSATAFPVGGLNNHVVLTGHRGMPSAKMFSDLDQLEAGDFFFIYILDEVLAYQVDQIKIVEPSDTTDLRPVEDKDYVTLLTCHPYAVNSHRLLVRGERTELSELPLESLNGIPVILAVITVLLLLLIITVSVIAKRLAPCRDVHQPVNIERP